jgi:hypothetical protein
MPNKAKKGSNKKAPAKQEVKVTISESMFSQI